MARRRLRLSNSGPFVKRADGSLPIAGDIVTSDADGAPVYAPGAGGGGGVSWVTSMFVAGDASPVGQDGTPGHPFVAIQAAHDALPIGGGNIYVAPSVAGYPDPLVFDRAINLNGWSVGTIAGGAVNAVGGVVVGSITTTALLEATNIGAPVNDWTGVAMALTGCTCRDLTGERMVLRDCVARDVASTQLHGTSCNLTGDITISGGTEVIELIDTIFSGTATFPAAGVLRMDYYTTYRFLTDPGGGTIVNGLLEVLGSPGLTTITVPTPALVAGVLGYIDVTLVGTILEGTNANTPILMNPRADLVPGGATQGFYIGARMTALDTARLSFVGTLPGGDVLFDIARFGH